MTEEEKNAQVDNQQDQTTDEFEVVMPEATRSEMTATGFKDQPDYLENFANFYISKFNQNDLEIMNLFDKNHNIVDIDDYLINNQSFSRKELVKHVLNIHDYNFENLLKEINSETGLDAEKLASYEDWDTWYESRRKLIPGTLS